MNHPLTLNQKDHEAVIERIAEILVSRIHIDLDELVIISVATVAQITGLSQKSVSHKFPITEISSQKRGVLLKFLREHIAKNTRYPNP